MTQGTFCEDNIEMKNIACFLLMVWGIMIPPAHADLELNINKGTLKPIRIALPNFGGSMGDQITAVVAADLKRTGLFEIIPQEAFIQQVDSPEDIRFADWRLINAEALTMGDIQSTDDGKLRAEFRLFDVVREAQTEGKAFTAEESEWRRIAHKISDAIYERLTREGRYLDSKIVYVSRHKVGKHRRDRLAVMDQDGANIYYLTEGKTIVLSPRFSPDMRHLIYTDYVDNKVAKVFMLDLVTKQKTALGQFQGLTFAPRMSPDGKKLVMSYAKNGRTSLYEINLETRQYRPLTNEPVIDTSPCYSHDGTKIVFCSDRAGQTQLYVMDAQGSTPERISFGPGSYRTPVWSPRGDLIVFTKILRGEFYIGIMRPDGSGERLLTKGYLVESPCWSPNGRVILYTREKRHGDPRLYTIDITGYNDQELPTQESAAHGAWSPLIP